MESINIPLFHEKILAFLLNWRKRNPGFTFSLRKSDLSKRLSSGYWFHGNDEYIAISFWTGMDWQSRVPNISFIIIPQTDECFLQFSAKDSSEKDELINRFFKQEFDLHESTRSFYYAPLQGNGNLNCLENLEQFLQTDKILIDQVIFKNKALFQTRHNPKNGIAFINEEEFQKNFKKTQKFRKTSEKSNMPIALFELDIENFGLIKKLVIDDIPGDAQWIFFTGENGTGKTTVLKAIATAIMNGNIKFDKRNEGILERYSIALTMQKNGNKSTRNRIKRMRSPVGGNKLIHSKGFACFGPVRLNIQEFQFSVAGRRMSDMFSKPYEQLFSTISPLIDIGYIYNRTSESKLRTELVKDEEKLRFIVEAITSICPSIVDIHFTRGMRYYEVDKDKKTLNKGGSPFKDLASGYKSIIAMVSHMMLHLYHQQPETNDPSLLEGIVLIDEIDLHFHPKMQRDLVIKLSEIFPRIQFIASTHSPIPLLGVNANTPIFTTNLDAERGIYLERMNSNGQITDLLPNAILTSPIFDLQEIIPKSYTGEQLVNTEDNYSDIVFSKMLDEKLAELNKKYTDD